MNTPTPRTDDAQWGTGKVTTDFARTLERELAESKARIAECENIMVFRQNIINRQEPGCVEANKHEDAEREKVRVLRLACERIVAEWDSAYDANPIGAGGWMYSLASKALAATDDAQ
jgi:hypothetical protein